MRSVLKYDGDGVTTSWPLAFPGGYRDTDDITVESQGVSLGIEFTSSALVTVLGGPIAAGVPLFIKRTENSQALARVFSNGAALRGPSIDAVSSQLLRLIHEVQDGRLNPLTQELEFDPRAHSRRIRNLHDPVLAGDAATKNYVDLMLTGVDGFDISFAGIGKSVRSPEYQMDNLGVENCSPVLAQMLLDGHRVIYFPEGTYRFISKVNVPAGVRLLGAGWNSVDIIAEDAFWIEVFRNNDGNLGTTDWCRFQCEGFTINMRYGGIRFWGHEVRIRELRFVGGGFGMNMSDPTTWDTGGANSSRWCIWGTATNEFLIENISAGYGGGGNGSTGSGEGSANTLFANGIRIDALNINGAADAANYTPALTNGGLGHPQWTVNYGDGLIQEVSAKGRAKNWIGLCIAHESLRTGRMNMISVHRCQFQAADVPTSLRNPTAVVDGHSVLVHQGIDLYSWAGSYGVYLKRVHRCVFTAVNTESSHYGWGFFGSYKHPDGNPLEVANGYVSTERNTLIMCPCMNSALNYVDNNSEFAGFVRDNYFQGSQSHGPMQPTGITTDDDEAVAGMFDLFLQEQLWWTNNSGLPKVWARVAAGTDDFMIGVTGPQRDTSGDALPYSYDAETDTFNLDNSHIRQDYPQHALAHRFGNNEVQLRLPRGEAQGLDRRLKLGNDAGWWNYKVSSDPAGTLESIVLANPLLMEPQHTAQPPLRGSLSQGTIIYAGEPQALGGGNVSYWAGPGLYVYLDKSTSGSFQGDWFRINTSTGFIEGQIGRSGASYDLAVTDFGRLASYGHGSVDQVLNIVPDLIHPDYVQDGTNYGAITAKAHKPGREFWVARTGTALVTLVPGTGVTLYHPSNGGSGNVVIPQWCTVHCKYFRHGAGDFRVFISGF